MEAGVRGVQGGNLLGDGADINAPEWTDPKRYLWLLGLSVPASPLIAWALYALTGFTAVFWIGPIVVFGLIPFLDWKVGVDAENPPERALAWLEEDRYYRWCTYAFLPLQFVSLVAGCWLWAYGDLGFAANFGLALTVGSVSGVGINTAHELGHKRASIERWLSKVALAPTFYGHFFIEHNRGHHVRVATPEDPASSRLGETFWEFLPRTVIGSFKSAWGIEKKRFDRLGKSPWSIHNDVLNAWLMSVVLFSVLIATFGVVVLPWLVFQAVYGFSLLESVNYLEHYGLLRQRGEDGRYERCQPKHSWNCNNVVTNVALYHLQRHSDHHAHPTRRYQALRHYSEAPELPMGYNTMILATYFPPVWYRVMDHRVLKHYGGDVTQANIHPRARKRILKKYGAPTVGSATASGVGASHA